MPVFFFNTARCPADAFRFLGRLHPPFSDYPNDRGYLDPCAFDRKHHPFSDSEQFTGYTRSVGCSSIRGWPARLPCCSLPFCLLPCRPLFGMNTTVVCCTPHHTTHPPPPPPQSQSFASPFFTRPTFSSSSSPSLTPR